VVFTKSGNYLEPKSLLIYEREPIPIAFVLSTAMNAMLHFSITGKRLRLSLGELRS
jgi:hypothetical protein